MADLRASIGLSAAVLLLWAGSCTRTREIRVARSDGARPTVTGELGRRVDEFLGRMTGFGYSGNILLVVDGQTVLRTGYGLADRARGLAYTPETVFDIGSMAKTFTAAAVVKLELAGRLGLHDPLGRWLPDAPEDKRPITIHQLLTHTAGVCVDFPYRDPMTPYEDVGRDETLRRILARPLDYAPGAGAEYSNCGYILLAAIVERAAGRPFHEYLREEVFAPAGLQHTGFWGAPRLRAEPVALGYNEYGEVQHDPRLASATTWQDLGGGQIVSTLDDLERWVRALANGRVLPAEAVGRLWTSWSAGLSARDGDYGYGWFLQQTPRGSRVVQHGGDYMGCGAELEFYPDDRVLLITSTNVRHDLYPTRNRTDRVIPQLVFGGDVVQPPTWVPSPETLRAVLGTYRLPSGGHLVIHERGGRFFIGGQGQDATDVLFPAAEDVRRRRAELSRNCGRALEDLRRGELEAFAELSGGGARGLEFAQAVVQELADLRLGALERVEVLGTFASGFPRGNPPDYESTLLWLTFARGASAYAVRWDNGTVALTEFPRFAHTANTEIQCDAAGELVSWHIVFRVGVRITPRREGSRVSELVVHAPGGDLVAVKVDGV